MTSPDDYPRDDWLAALYTHGPRGAPRRAVARVFADFARGDLTWCPIERIEKRTGLARRTIYYALYGYPEVPARPGRRAERALPGLIQLGWLEPVTKRRQHYSPRYRLTIPEVQELQPPEVQELPPEVQELRARGAGAATRGAGAATRGAGNAPDTSHTPATPPTPAPTAGRAASLSPGREMADELLVVVGSRGIRPDRRIVVRECQQLAEQFPAWTPKLIAAAARRHDWNGAGPGAVIGWIRGLEEPEPDQATWTSGPREKCPTHRQEMPCRGCAADRLAGQ